MACGCNKSTVSPDLSKAIACHMCIYAEHGPSAMNDGAVSCTIDGKPVCGRVACPKGKFGANGLIKSLGVWHYGAAYWQRVIVWALKRTHPKPGAFPFCGCVKVLRDWWDSTKTQSVNATTANTTPQL